MAGILVVELLMWYVYLLQSEVSGKYYVGMTSDVFKRLREHNAGKTKSIKAYVPYKLVGYKEFTDKIDARKYEIKVKKSYLTKQEFIAQLTSTNFSLGAVSSSG